MSKSLLMTNAIQPGDVPQLVQSLINEGRSLPDLEKMMDEQQWPEAERNEALQYFRKHKNSKRIRVGLFLVAIGCVLCVFGFVVTLIMLQQNANFHLALYGATGLGGLLLLGGLVMVMG